jgi:hypothetical protein
MQGSIETDSEVSGDILPVVIPYPSEEEMARLLIHKANDFFQQNLILKIGNPCRVPRCLKAFEFLTSALPVSA